MSNSDINEYVPLKTIVSYTLDETDQSIGSFDRGWILAFRALVDIFLTISGEPISVRLPVSANKTVPFPADKISWSKIGVLNDNGEVCTIKINNALTTYKDNNPNRLSRLTSDVQNALPLLINNPFFINFFYNGTYQPLFGVGGGLIQYGSCTVYEKNNIIVLDPDFQYTHIILEYISSPEKNGDYTIPITCQEAVIAFIKWKSKLGTRDEYYAAKIEARRSMPKKKVHLQNINQVIRESNGMKLLA